MSACRLELLRQPDAVPAWCFENSNALPVEYGTGARWLLVNETGLALEILGKGILGETWDVIHIITYTWRRDRKA